VGRVAFGYLRTLYLTDFSAFRRRISTDACAVDFERCKLVTLSVDRCLQHNGGDAERHAFCLRELRLVNPLNSICLICRGFVAAVRQSQARSHYNEPTP